MPAAAAPGKWGFLPCLRLRRACRAMPGRCLLLMLLLVIFLPASLLAGPRDLENRVKAAFLFHFTKFVEWPPASLPDASSPLRICVLGSSELEPLLLPLQQRQAGTHPLLLRRVETSDEIRGCQLLYLPLQQADRLQPLLAMLESYPVLTVSSIPDFAEQGGMIGFVRRDNRIRLEMNLAATREAGLQVNAQLIEVSERIFHSEASSAQQGQALP
jgi:hypothetical protein